MGTLEVRLVPFGYVPIQNIAHPEKAGLMALRFMISGTVCQESNANSSLVMHGLAKQRLKFRKVAV